MSGIGAQQDFAGGEEELVADPFESVPQETRDAVRAALEDPRAVVNGWRQEFKERAGDVTDPEWETTTRQEEHTSGELVNFPGATQPAEAQAQADFAMEAANNPEALDSRLAS